MKGTTGLATMDYYRRHRHVVPEGTEQYYRDESADAGRLSLLQPARGGTAGRSAAARSRIADGDFRQLQQSGQDQHRRWWRFGRKSCAGRRTRGWS